MNDLPFDEEPETVLEWAVRINPDENWDTCCVCGATESDAGGQGLVRGLVLLADLTLGRAAWCWKVGCSGERYSSTYIPESLLRGV